MYLLLCVIVCTCALLCVLVVVRYCVYLLLCVIVCTCCCVLLCVLVVVCYCVYLLLCVLEQLRVDNSSPGTNWEQLATGFFYRLFIYVLQLEIQLSRG